MDHKRPHLFTSLTLHALSWQCNSSPPQPLSRVSQSDYMGPSHFSIRGDHPNSTSWLGHLLEPPNAHLPIYGIWPERLSEYLPMILCLQMHHF